MTNKIMHALVLPSSFSVIFSKVIVWWSEWCTNRSSFLYHSNLSKSLNGHDNVKLSPRRKSTFSKRLLLSIVSIGLARRKPQWQFIHANMQISCNNKSDIKKKRSLITFKLNKRLAVPYALVAMQMIWPWSDTLTFRIDNCAFSDTIFVLWNQ